MKTIKFKQIINQFLTIAILLVLTTSCEQEELQPSQQNLEEILDEYPSEITLENLHQFVDAPQVVINHFIEKENSEFVTDQNESTITVPNESIEERAAWGWVRAWRSNNFRPIPNVRITLGPYLAFSSSSYGDNYVIAGSGSLCMSYNTSALNGVSTLDIVQIDRHITGNRQFNTFRQFVAADVNGDGQISSADSNMLRQLILGIRNSVTGGNVVFVASNEYNEGINAINTLGSIIYSSPCYSHNVPDRYAIKIGDLTGNFNF